MTNDALRRSGLDRESSRLAALRQAAKREVDPYPKLDLGRQILQESLEHLAGKSFSIQHPFYEGRAVENGRGGPGIASLTHIVCSWLASRLIPVGIDAALELDVHGQDVVRDPFTGQPVEAVQ